MATALETRRDATIDPTLAKAYKIIDQAWIDLGVSPEALAREDTMVDVYEGLVAQGQSHEEANHYLKITSWEAIQQKHRELYPRRYESNGTS